MEDVKEPGNRSRILPYEVQVSILVLMEDVKEHGIIQIAGILYEGFNPCFNGRCKRTIQLSNYRFLFLGFQSLF